METRTQCPDCGSEDFSLPDEDGWQYCNNCDTDFAPEYEPGDE